MRQRKEVQEKFNIQEDWHRFRDRAFEKIAIGWLEENGIPYIRDTVTKTE